MPTAGGASHPRNVYVCYLPTNFTNRHLVALFSSFGKIQSARMISKRGVPVPHQRPTGATQICDVTGENEQQLQQAPPAPPQEPAEYPNHAGCGFVLFEKEADAAAAIAALSGKRLSTVPVASRGPPLVPLPNPTASSDEPPPSPRLEVRLAWLTKQINPKARRVAVFHAPPPAPATPLAGSSHSEDGSRGSDGSIVDENANRGGEDDGLVTPDIVRPTAASLPMFSFVPQASGYPPLVGPPTAAPPHAFMMLPQTTPAGYGWPAMHPGAAAAPSVVAPPLFFVPPATPAPMMPLAIGPHQGGAAAFAPAAYQTGPMAYAAPHFMMMAPPGMAIVPPQPAPPPPFTVLWPAPSTTPQPHSPQQYQPPSSSFTSGRRG